MSDAEILKIGNKIKRKLQCANKKNGFFDWQYANFIGDDFITYEFYWNELDNKNAFYLFQFMINNDLLNPLLGAGTHDNYNDNVSQIKLILTYPINSNIIII